MAYKKAVFNNFVNPDAEINSQEIDKKRLLADALRKQSMEPLNTNVGYNISPLEGVAKIVQALAGRKLEKDATEEQKKANKESQAALIKALGGNEATGGEGSVGGATASSPFSVARLLKGSAISQIGGEGAAGAYWDDAKKTNEMKNWAAMGLNPADVGSLEMRKKAADSLLNIAQGNNIVDPTTGRSIYTAPKIGEGQVYQDGQIANIPGYVGAASQVAGATSGAKALSEALNKPMAVENNQGQKVWTNEATIARGNPLISPSDADKKVNENLKVKAADDFIDSSYKATEAIKSINTINRLKEAVGSGNIMSGPLADSQMVMSQIANKMGVQGKTDEERLLNTRTAIQGLAQLAINTASGMKGQGQISDFERKLLEKANSGNITDLTPPEMGKLLDIFDKSARAVVERNNKFANEFSYDPKFEGMVRHYKVEMPETYKQGGSFKIRSVRDK